VLNSLIVGNHPSLEQLFNPRSLDAKLSEDLPRMLTESGSVPEGTDVASRYVVASTGCDDLHISGVVA
jgi:hypothetical protein